MDIHELHALVERRAALEAMMKGGKSPTIWCDRSSTARWALSGGNGQPWEFVVLRDRWIAKEKPGEQQTRPGLYGKVLFNWNLVRQHSHILAAAMLVNDPLAGLFIDLVALATGFRDIFRRCFMAVA